jgi:hypothetical protein
MRSLPALVCAAAAALLPVAALADGFPTYEPVTLQPAVSRPAAPHCTVMLLKGRRFENGGAPRFASYAPPAACPGPWSKIVLTWRTRISGRQYDRTGALWIGRRELYHFTTAEPTKHGIDYTVEKDVTEYAPVLRSPAPAVVELANYTNAKYDGVYVVDASLTFYKATEASPAAPQADAILPVENDLDAQPWFSLEKPEQQASTTFSQLPRNIEHARLEVYSSSHGCDEFWYTNQPDGYAGRHKRDELCGGGAYREIDVTVDGKTAAAIAPFPWIYTGGINPMLWRPISAIDTLNVPPYQVDLDPFAGVLSDGKPHTIAISVRNDRGSWLTDANLFLWSDPKAAQTGGALVSSERAIPDASVTAHTSKTGGTFHTTAKGTWRVSGFVNTSHGRILHTVSGSLNFVNDQWLNLPSGAQTATQREDFTISTSATGARTQTLRGSYPLVADSVYTPTRKNGKYDLLIRAHVVQARYLRTTTGSCAERIDARATYERTRRYANSTATGFTSGTNACSGSLGKFTIRKAARNGSLLPSPR